MKNIRNCVICFLIGLFISLPVGAAVQYSLSESAWKMVVDGQVVQDEKLPVLLMEPGYNYLPAGAFRAVCEKAGIGFEADTATKEIRITTKQTVAVKSVVAPVVKVTVTPTPALITEPYTLERDGVKKVYGGDVGLLLEERGYKIRASGRSDNTLSIYDNDNNLVLKGITYTVHEYNNSGQIFLDYEFYEQNIKPLITD